MPVFVCGPPLPYTVRVPLRLELLLPSRSVELGWRKLSNSPIFGERQIQIHYRSYESKFKTNRDEPYQDDLNTKSMGPGEYLESAVFVSASRLWCLGRLSLRTPTLPSSLSSPPSPPVLRVARAIGYTDWVRMN